MFKLIPSFDHIYVDENGVILNKKTGRILKPHFDTNGYLNIAVSEFNEIKRIGIHRAVALCFCDGYKEGLVVDHIDGNKTNNNYKNLRWVTQKQNLEYGYERRGDTPFRNYCIVELYYNGKLVGSFWSKEDASKYAVKHYNCKYSMLRKHNKHNGCEIIEV